MYEDISLHGHGGLYDLLGPVPLLFSERCAPSISICGPFGRARFLREEKRDQGPEGLIFRAPESPLRIFLA
jgi:hypothetical protein